MDRVGEVPDRYLSQEQRLMRETCRRYVDEVVRPFIEADREREWLLDPAQRLPGEILAEADRTGLRGLGVPATYGGIKLDPAAWRIRARASHTHGVARPRRRDRTRSR